MAKKEAKGVKPPKGRKQFTTERSANMRAIRSTGNASTELLMAAVLRSAKISGWRRHYARVAGKPDFYWPRERVALFVDGCFWHGCPSCYRAPVINRGYWREKILRNRKRDRQVSRTLRAAGVLVIRVWECRLRSPTTRSRICRVLAESLARSD